MPITTILYAVIPAPDDARSTGDWAVVRLTQEGFGPVQSEVVLTVVHRAEAQDVADKLNRTLPTATPRGRP